LIDYSNYFTILEMIAILIKQKFWIFGGHAATNRVVLTQFSSASEKYVEVQGGGGHPANWSLHYFDAGAMGLKN
jgi:hypothetical protein